MCDEVVSVVVTGVFYAEVVDNEAKINWFCFVLKSPGVLPVGM